MTFSLSSSGSFKHSEDYLRSLLKVDVRRVLESCGAEGVRALSSATPTATGLAANSWTYEVKSSGGSTTISWLNTDIENGFPVAIMLQYGHGTKGGGYVSGRDYINPAMKPIFDRISAKVGEAVNRA